MTAIIIVGVVLLIVIAVVVMVVLPGNNNVTENENNDQPSTVSNELTAFHKFYVNTLNRRYSMYPEKIYNSTLEWNNTTIFEGLNPFNDTDHLLIVCKNIMSYAVQFNDIDSSLFNSPDLITYMRHALRLLARNISEPAALKPPWGHDTDANRRIFTVIVPETFMMVTCVLSSTWFWKECAIYTANVLEFILPDPISAMGWMLPEPDSIRAGIPYVYAQMLRDVSLNDIALDTSVRSLLDRVRFSTVVTGSGLRNDYIMVERNVVRSYVGLIQCYFVLNCYSKLFGEHVVNHDNFGCAVGATTRLAYAEVDALNNKTVLLWLYLRRIWNRNKPLVPYTDHSIYLQPGALCGLNFDNCDGIVANVTGAYMFDSAHTATLQLGTCGAMMSQVINSYTEINYLSYTVYHEAGMFQFYHKITTFFPLNMVVLYVEPDYIGTDELTPQEYHSRHNTFEGYTFNGVSVRSAQVADAPFAEMSLNENYLSKRVSGGATQNMGGYKMNVISDDLQARFVKIPDRNEDVLEVSVDNTVILFDFPWLIMNKNNNLVLTSAKEDVCLGLSYLNKILEHFNYFGEVSPINCVAGIKTFTLNDPLRSLQFMFLINKQSQGRI